MFVYIHIMSLDIHVLLCVDKPIDEDHVITHLVNVFLYYQSFYLHHNY